LHSEGGKIELSSIDARTRQAGDQAFSVIGSNAFPAAGQVRVIHQGGAGREGSGRRPAPDRV
jgi:hypothetical protein